MTIKDDLHRLVDTLPEQELHAALRYMEYLHDVGSDELVGALLEAPEDDEPITTEEAEGADEAWQEYLRGEARPWEEVRKELGHE
jgi:hypothetical protein